MAACSIVTLPRHQQRFTANNYARKNVPPESFERDDSQSNSDQELECEIIDLYADSYPDSGENDGLWTEVADLLRTMEPAADLKNSRPCPLPPTPAIHVTLDDMPVRIRDILAQDKPPLRRHISQALSVRDGEMHSDVSRVVRSLRDGSSLDRFVLERIHSCTSSLG
jgi:hypothetical protein